MNKKGKQFKTYKNAQFYKIIFFGVKRFQLKYTNVNPIGSIYDDIPFAL